MSTPPLRTPGQHRSGAGSLRLRIVVWVTLTVLLIIVAMFLFSRTILLNSVTERANEDVVQELAEFERFNADAVDPATGEPFTNARDLIGVYMSRQIPGDQEAMIGLVEENRGLIQPDFSALSGGRPAPLNMGSPLVAEIRDSPHASGVFHDDERGQVHWGRVHIANTESGQPATFAAVSFVAEDRARAERQVQQLALLGLAGGLLSIAVIWLLAGRISAPIRKLEEVSSSISNSDLTARVPVTGDREVAHLAATFNAMLDRIEVAYKDQRQFVDDAGHELRTPITVVRGQLELLESSSPEERARSIQLATAELDRMARMVDDLLILAVSDSGNLVHPAEVDVAELTIDIEDKASTLSERIQLVDVAEGTVYLDEQRVTQAVLELCRNALHYSEGQVDIGSSLIGSGASRALRVWVRDTGQGISEDKQAHLFDRFARGEQPDTSRPSGAGLGLSIVQAIARAHGGSVHVSSSLGVGSTFGLDIPAPESTEELTSKDVEEKT